MCNGKRRGKGLTRIVIGSPVCDCPIGGPIDGWDEDGDSEGVADIESEADGDADFEVGDYCSVHWIPAN